MASTSKDFGVAHFYGLYGTVTYATIQSDSWSESFKLDVEVSDEEGRVITDRLDDLFQELTLEGVMLTAGLLPDIGTQFTYGGETWILKNIEDKGTNKDFRKFTVKGVKYQEIA
jgi:hypothetical protein